jgi:hypothetical protein
MSVTEEQDPLVEPYSPDRVYYATGVLLDATDFSAEQVYHRGRLARALAYVQGSGTVVGLKVEWVVGSDTQEEEITVHPGMAVDRLGRIIEVPRDACIRLAVWFDALAQSNPSDLVEAFHTSVGGVIADVFIKFVSCERGKTPSFAAGPFDATDAAVPSRLRDAYQLDLVVRKEQPGPPPLPVSPWPDLASDADINHRRATLRDLIFGGWKEGTDNRDQNGLPNPLPEHVANQDTTSLFLARLVIPATAGSPPARTADPVQVDNNSRSFVYPAGALARWIGL